VKLDLTASPQLLATLLIVLAILIAIGAYLTRYPGLPRHRRWILLGARLLALAALLIASFAPVLRYPDSSRGRNRLVILVDHSGSMDVRDAPGGRSRRAVADSMATAIAGSLGNRYDVRIGAFDAALGPMGRDAKASLQSFQGGGETALGDAIHGALTRVDPDSMAAFLILSDGIVNRGEDPERALNVSLPTFGVTVGRPADPPTVGIAGVESPPELILGKPTPIVVTVREGTRTSSEGIVRVSEEGRELGRGKFSLTGAGASARVSIPVTETIRGKRFLTIELLDVADDPMRQNKERLIAVDARPAKRSVPVLAATWDWDLRSLARGVEEDTTWQVVRYSPSGASQVLRFGPGAGGATSFESALEDAEALVVRYDASVITPERAAAILRYLDRGGGVLFWIDPATRPPADSPLTREVGIAWRMWSQPIGPGASPELAPAGRTHEIALLGGDAGTATAVWKALPPVEPLVMLGTAGSPLVPVLQGRIGNDVVPLLLAGSVGKGRVALLNASGVYRWGLTASGIAGQAGVESAFFGGISQWLAGGREERPVRITTPDITPEGRAIALRVTSTLPGGVAGTQTVVSARGQSGSKLGTTSESRLTVAAEGGGYAGAITLPRGTYLLQAKVFRGGRLVGSDSTRAAVGEEGIEYEALAADPGTLPRLSEGTGGIAAPIDSSGRVLASLRSPDLARVRLAEMDLFHNPFLFAILVLALTVEWALRRRFHLM